MTTICSSETTVVLRLHLRLQLYSFWTSSKTNSQLAVYTRSIETRRYRVRLGLVLDYEVAQICRAENKIA